jgi:SAM-dependent methyltransferase
MDIILSEEQIEECIKKFNLSYHVSQTVLCQQLVGIAGKDVLEVGGSLPYGFVFDYLKARTWTSIETPDYDKSLIDIGGINHTGTLLKDCSIQIKNFSDGAPTEKYTFYHDNIENMPDSLNNRFDLIFSLAAFEHIHKLPQALSKMYDALRLGGKLYTLFSPVWSSFHGHHLPDIKDKKGNSYNFMNSPIPPWGHLLYSPPEMLEYLSTVVDRETACSMIYYIYNAPNINRFFIEDYLQFIRQTKFNIEKFDVFLPVNEYPEEYKTKLTSRYPGRTFFNYDGLIIVLCK